MQVVHARTTRPLNGLIWPKAGFASIVWPQRRRKTFFPWACPPIPREPRKFRAPVLHFVPVRQADASPIASGLQIAIEAAVVAGSKTARR
jgi:hypothetical protein